MPGILDDLVSCDEIEDTLESTSINLSNGMNYCLIAVALLAIAFLLTLVAIIVKYCMKL